MGTLNRGAFLAAAAAAMGLGHLDASMHAGAPPLLAYHSVGRRTRTPGPRRPAGSKLARQAEKRRIGIAVLR